jgi:hypothetical protein
MVKSNLTLEDAISIKRREILLVRENIGNVQDDLKYKKAQLHELELELATLHRALAIVQGQRNYVALPVIDGELPIGIHRRASGREAQAGSVFLLAEQILRVANRSMTAGELLPIIIDRRTQLGLAPVTRQGMAGVLYRLAKRGEMFVYHGSGKFGLKEWQGEKPNPTFGGTWEALKALP